MIWDEVTFFKSQLNMIKYCADRQISLSIGCQQAFYETGTWIMIIHKLLNSNQNYRHTSQIDQLLAKDDSVHLV